MWFKIISYVIGALFLSKALIAIVYHTRFYAWLRRQCLSETFPPALAALVVDTAVLAAVTWYAAIFHYAPFGWFLAALMSLALAKALGFYFMWERSSKFFVRVLDASDAGLWALDFSLVLYGFAFFLLGHFVY